MQVVHERVTRLLPSPPARLVCPEQPFHLWGVGYKPSIRNGSVRMSRDDRCGVSQRAKRRVYCSRRTLCPTNPHDKTSPPPHPRVSCARNNPSTCGVWGVSRLIAMEVYLCHLKTGVGCVRGTTPQPVCQTVSGVRGAISTRIRKTDIFDLVRPRGLVVTRGTALPPVACKAI